MKCIILYYSRSGNTRVVANALARELGCDIEEIVDDKKRTGVVGSAGAYLSRSKKTSIKEIESKLDDYDVVIVGTPIWWYTISPAAWELLRRYSGLIGQVSLLYTCGKDVRINAERDVEELYGKAPVVTVGIESGNIKSGSFKEQLGAFVTSLS